MAEIEGVSVDRDEAGNLWAQLPGDGSADGFVIVGSHIDAVPSGGWLDGALGVTAALEVLRTLAAAGAPPPIAVRLVDWADEEGARFGRSLVGSSAVAGTLDPDDVRGLRDAGGMRLQDAMASVGVDLDGASAATARLDGARAYLELHIEQGPVLLDGGRLASAVSGTFGDERYLVAFSGQSAHAGSTPMRLRRDTLAAAANAALEIREVGIRHGGVTTVGAITSSPAVITAIAGESEMMLDLRHLDAEVLAIMLAECLDACERAGGAVRLRGRPASRLRRDADAVSSQVDCHRTRRGGRRRWRGRRHRSVRPAARRDRDRPPGADRHALRPVDRRSPTPRSRVPSTEALRSPSPPTADGGRPSPWSPPATWRTRADGLGVVLQNDPPAARVIDLSKRAESWLLARVDVDSHLLWEEPYVIYSRILNETHKLIVGPMVTNPATRDWTVRRRRSPR